MTNPDDLERLARAATPGPWQINGSHIYGHEPRRDLICQVLTDYGHLEQDRAFIAAANPATILALLSANREMRAALQKLSYQMNFLSRMADGQKRCERGKGPATWKTTIDAIRSEALVGEDYARSALTTQRGDGE